MVADWAVESEVATVGAATAADQAAATAVEAMAEATAEVVKAVETVEAGSEEDLPIRT